MKEQILSLCKEVNSKLSEVFELKIKLRLNLKESQRTLVVG